MDKKGIVELSSVEEQIMNKNKMELLGGTLVGMMVLSGCAAATETNQTQTVEAASTLGSGEILPIGLLDTSRINSLPESEVKNSFQAELLSVKEDCLKIPNCLGETVKIYRVVIPNDVYSIRFADFKTENEPLHTEILSMMEGKNQKVTEINQDLLVKETVVDGVDTKVFGYVDNLGNSHYILVNQGEKNSLYDPEGNVYDVVAQNAKEVQSYASFWREPIVVQAEALPSPTPIVTETPTLEPTKEPTVAPTEKPLIEGDIFFDPQTKEDFSKLVESPSPIDSPEAFAKWQDEYLKQVNEKLKTYTGPSINIVGLGIDYQFASLLIVADKWPVIASYEFNWQGQEILTKTFIFKDNNENLIPLSLTYTTPDSMIFDSITLYTTPSTEKNLDFSYEWNTQSRSVITDKFMESFLPDEKGDINYDAYKRVIVGTGTMEDIKTISRGRFVMAKFN
jgi:hypothetical protein